MRARLSFSGLPEVGVSLITTGLGSDDKGAAVFATVGTHISLTVRLSKGGGR